MSAHQLASVAAAFLLASVPATSALAIGVHGQGTWETSLLPRDLNGDGVADAYFDAAQSITWLADANFSLTSGQSATGQMDWFAAMSWAAGLQVGTTSGWRLPVTFDMQGHNNPHLPPPGSSELAYMYYVTLGNIGSPNLGNGLSNTGPFANIQEYPYWSSPEIPGANGAFALWMGMPGNAGGQQVYSFGNLLNAWAVHDGDVGASLPVPEPGSLLMLSAGLIFLAAKRKYEATSR
ncbi:MAG TPA: PEP-CTERM sorting domain-containing protein [Chthoniobacter sp.]|nr:PEP-CTERM sorting domain-containing protein [Chthoniobacter sp.]